MTFKTTFFLSSLMIVVVSCGETSENCEPGSQEECTCPGGSKSLQECLPDGSGWDDCDCDVDETCHDGFMNQNETDVDCGGVCVGCDEGQDCLADGDCLSGLCGDDGTCLPGGDETCDDEIINQDETDTDCGGSCPPCPDGSDCVVDDDCESVNCVDGICQPEVETCNDFRRNQDETDVDCGGAVCAPCPDGADCLVDDDCISGSCTDNVCDSITVTCYDGQQNGKETDVDCGGVCPPCPEGWDCILDSDCQSGFCDEGVCVISGDDLCPDDPDKTAPGVCGCGVPDTDSDGDGFADCIDCDDADAEVNPVAAEVCDDVDNDCDGDTDEGFPAKGAFCDGDDEDACPNGTWVCNAPGDALECANDVPAIEEACDGRDNNCDGFVDEDWPNLGNACDGDDEDACANGHIVCNEARDDVVCAENPALNQEELCNGMDDDCDGDIDEGLGTYTCGVGVCENTVEVCVDGESQSCIPLDPSGNIEATCDDGLDNDCDGFTDMDDLDCM